MQTVSIEQRYIAVTNRLERFVCDCFPRNCVSKQMIGKIEQIFLPRHLVKNMQPAMLPAGDHLGGHARAYKSSRERDLRASERSFDECFPTTLVTKLRVVAPLASHGAQIQCPALAQ